MNAAEHRHATRRMGARLSGMGAFAVMGLVGLGPAHATPTVTDPTHGTTRPAADLALALGPSAVVTWNATHTAPARIDGLSVATEGSDVGGRALGFVRSHATLFGLVGEPTVIEVRQATFVGQRRSFVRIAERFEGALIEGRSLVVNLDPALRVTSVTSDFGPLSIARPTRTMTPEAAQDLVRATFALASVSGADKVVITGGRIGRVAWRVRATFLPMTAWFDVWVDVETGAVLRQRPAAADQTMRELPLRGEDR